MDAILDPKVILDGKDVEGTYSGSKHVLIRTNDNNDKTFIGGTGLSATATATVGSTIFILHSMKRIPGWTFFTRPTATR